MKRVIQILLTISCLNGICQNLVPNPGFESYFYDKENKHKVFLDDWFFQTKGKAIYQYYNKDLPSNQRTPENDTVIQGIHHYAVLDHGVPKNKYGYQYPKTGKGYITNQFTTYKPTWRGKGYLGGAFIQCKLKAPLIEGQKYYFEFYCSLTEFSLRGTNTISIALSERALRSSKYGKYPIVKTFTDRIITEREDWVQIADTFTAKGGEQFFAIGNFVHFKQWKFSKKRKKYPDESRRVYKEGGHFTEYYIDDVNLIPVNNKGEEIILYPDLLLQDSAISMEDADTGIINTKKNIVLKNVYFETGESELLPASYEELEKLRQILAENQHFKIQITGHTDTTGNAMKNLELSHKRAKAVAGYLTGKGISGERITYKGYGSSKPIADNTTEAGRAQNRRVEFRVVRE